MDHVPPKFLAYFVISCFERLYPKKSCCSPRMATRGSYKSFRPPGKMYWA